MSDHLTPEALAALADGELAAGDLGAAKAHLDQCLTCANRAVDEWLLKTPIAKAGQRFEASAAFLDRMAGMISEGAADSDRPRPGASRSFGRSGWVGFAGWAIAATMIVVLGSWGIVGYRARIGAMGNERAATIGEACDLHIAMLAANQPPEVVSSDRHTVKPWFQGKLPFSFNIPEALPADTTLDGANLAYLQNRPVAQLMFSIGRHHASVFLEQNASAKARSLTETSRSGFQIVELSTDEVDVIAVSDVDPARLEALASDLKEAQLHR